MPSANRARAVFDTGKTASYHVTTIANCSQSSKNSALFKLIINRAGANPPKRYDFEAENPKLAGTMLYSVLSRGFPLLSSVLRTSSGYCGKH